MRYQFYLIQKVKLPRLRQGHYNMEQNSVKKMISQHWKKKDQMMISIYVNCQPGMYNVKAFVQFDDVL